MTDLASPPLQDGARLRAERERQGLSMRELAHFSNCSHVTIQRLEAGTADASVALKVRLARSLGIPVAELWSAPEATAEQSPTTSNAPAGDGGVAQAEPGGARHEV